MRRSFYYFLAAIIMMIFPAPDHTASGAEGFFQITVIDVGKGDCILVQTGDPTAPHTVMIDTGYKETAKDVIKFLKKQGILQIDALIISHFHKDHVGGAATILEDKDIQVGRVYMPDYEGTRKVYEQMMKVLQDENCTIPYERLKKDGAKSFRIGDAVYSLYPSRIDFDGDNDNNVSMAATVEYQGHTALFAGDLEDEGIEKFLADNDIPKYHYDILKLPHHGAQENNTGNLLSRLKKQDGIVVITDGQNKRAHGTLIDMLEGDSTSYYCSAEDGNIYIKADSTADREYSVSVGKEPEILTDGIWKYILSDDGTAAIAGYTGNETNITLPSVIGTHPVTSVTDSAFYNSKELTDVTIPDSVTSIGASAFSWCTSLEEITIPDSVVSVGDAAFSWCTSLEEITIPDSVTSIGESGFEHCSNLKSAVLSKGLTAIAPSLFERCENLSNIDIPDGVTEIGKDAFKRCEKLQTVRIPGSVKLIDEGAFKRCSSLTEADIPEGVETVEESAFENCTALRSINLPESVSAIGKAAFQYCENLRKVVIPDGVDTIKKSTFAECTRLEEVSLPAGIKSIKADAFRNCRNLRIIRFGGTLEDWEALDKGENWLSGNLRTVQVICTDGTAEIPGTAPVDGGAQTGSRFFRMESLPATGFSAFQTKTLSIRSSDLYYEPTGMMLQIPSLDVSEEIVRIPFADGTYPVEWLENDIGLPEEFAEPGAGPCILIGHNHLNTDEAGPFALLSSLEEGSRLLISDSGSGLKVFSVFLNVKIPAGDLAAVQRLTGLCDDPLILITCEDEQPGGGYASRRVIAARPL